MRVRRVIIIEKEIERCFYDCPYFESNTGIGYSMWCAHPMGGLIVDLMIDEVMDFPQLCPLLAEKKTLRKRVK